ncbi:TPA: hypothetical protein EYP45_01755 [Candidatus Peregrinibacteria bacterium]|nr:hypothetical protein [Candidatus Peregrinibacteria bacterium]
MKQVTFKEKYPVFTLDILKTESRFSSVSEIISYFQEKIVDHPVAVFISTFNHFSHTKNLGELGEINSEIVDAQNIIFCFGKELPNALVLAVRPRSIGVAEFSDRFVISFMETPSPQTTVTIEAWIKSVVA